MQQKEVNTLILGAGPAGLAAAYRLTERGFPPILLERDSSAGGLMRSLTRGDFVVDIGRKELYSRIPEVDRFWTALLGNDYRPYLRRVGILFKGQVLETSRSYRGISLGMTWHLLAACCSDFLWWSAKPHTSALRNYAEYSYRKRGRLFSQVLSQGFSEKFFGTKWADLPVPQAGVDAGHTSFWMAIRNKLLNAVVATEPESYWRHPVKGTGQLCDRIVAAIVEGGGILQFCTEVRAMTASAGSVDSVTAESNGVEIAYFPKHVISSLPVEQNLAMLGLAEAIERHAWPTDTRKRGTLLVYLFVNEPPRFPHVWLEVTCPERKAARITSYGNFGGHMVPTGQTCLCVEFFCAQGDVLPLSTDAELCALAVAECASANLVTAERVLDYLIVRLPNADAATHPNDYLNEKGRQSLALLGQFNNLYYVNRAGTDIATYAGLQAAEAVVSSDRSEFDRRNHPSDVWEL